MKNYIAIGLILIITPAIQAYKESFSNHTDKNIAIGMKYKGSKNLEFITVPAQEKQEFEPDSAGSDGMKSTIASDKSNAIPSSWHYLIDPPLINEDNKNSLMWIPLQIIWLNTQAYKNVLALVQAINKSDKSAKTITDLIKSQSHSAISEISQAFESAEYNLGSFISAVGKDIGNSMAQDLHIDIIADENGNIHFISEL